MKNALLLFIFIFSFQIVLSQNKFRQGYIVKLNNDTITGLINYRDNPVASKLCQFRLSEDQPLIEYSPDEIQGYGFVGDRYFLAKADSTEKSGSGKMFFEVLTEGRISLYKYNDRFFAEKGDTLMCELTRKQTEAVVDGRRVIYDSKRYLGLLTFLMADCDEIKTRIPKTELYERSLTELVEDYNRLLTGSIKTYKANKKWTKINFGFYAGTIFSSVNFNFDELDYDFLKGPFEISGSAVAGLSIDIFSPRISERVSLHSGVSVNNSRYYSYSEYQYSDKTLCRNFVTIRLTQLKIPMGIGITFSGKKYIPHLNFGITNIINLNRSSQLHLEVETDNTISPYTFEAVKISGCQLGLFAAGGIERSFTERFSGYLEIKTEYSGSFAKYASFGSGNPIQSSRVGSIQLVLGILTR
jgi:hypothetical protein